MKVKFAIDSRSTRTESIRLVRNPIASKSHNDESEGRTAKRLRAASEEWYAVKDVPGKNHEAKAT